jgi:hypothetical protein
MMMATPPASKPPPPPGSERRRNNRLTIMAQVELRRGGEVVVLPVGNISAGGVLLYLGKLDGGRRTFRIGESVSVFLAVDHEGEELSLAMDAEVMRVDLGGPERPAGVGLMWTSKDPQAVATLARILGRLT